MSKLINLMRRNPGMTIGSIVLVIVLVAVVLWMVTRGGEKVTDPRPTIMFTTGTKVLNPAQKGTTETYVEYAGTKTAQYIDIVVNWQNGAGFTDKVTGLKFVRSKGTTTSGTTTYATLDTMYEDDIEKLKDFASGSVTFLGTNIPSNKSVDQIIGDNYIQVWYTTDDTAFQTSRGSTVNWLPSSGPLATTAAVPITIIDIDTTYNISQKQDVDVPISVSSSTFSGDKTDGKKTYYSIQTIDGTEIKKVRITEVVSGSVTSVTFLDESDAIYNFGLSSTSAITFKFEDYMGNKLLSYLDNSTRKYLQYDSNTGTITFVGKSDIFTDQATLNKSLLTVVELSFTEWGNFGDDEKYYFNTVSLPGDWNGSGTDGTWINEPEDVDACINACETNVDCAMFVYDESGKKCYMKTGKLKNKINTSNESDRYLIGKFDGPVYQKNSMFQYNGQSTGATNPVYKGNPNLPVRFIRFQNFNQDAGTTHGADHLHVNEVYVYDSNGNTVDIKGIQASENYGSGPDTAWDVSRIIDGNDALGGVVGDNPSANDNKFRWFEIDLGEVKQISAVAFVNRHGFANPVKKMQVMMTSEDGTLLEITPPISNSLAWNTKKIFHRYSIATKKWTDSEIDGFAYLEI
jgi:hypothetical protein